MKLIRLVAVTALLGLPVAANAQAAAPPQRAPTPSPAQAHPPPLKAQMAEAQARVMKAQQQALAKPAVKSEMQSVEKMVKARMVKADPKTQIDIARLEELEGKLKALAKDKQPTPEESQPIMREAQQIAQKLAPVQAKVMQEPDVQKRLKELEKTIMKEMAAIDPDVPQLIAMLKSASAGAPGHGGR